MSSTHYETAVRAAKLVLERDPASPYSHAALGILDQLLDAFEWDTGGTEARNVPTPIEADRVRRGDLIHVNGGEWRVIDDPVQKQPGSAWTILASSGASTTLELSVHVGGTIPRVAERP